MARLVQLNGPPGGGAAVLFDVDGVLVDSYAAYRRIWDRWADHRGLDPAIVWQHTHGRRPVDTIAVVAPMLDAEAEYRLLRAAMADDGEAFPVYPDAGPVLHALRSHRWGVVTSGRAPTVRHRLRAGGLPDPPVLVDSAQVTAGKPDPEGYLRAAGQLRVPPAHCLVIENWLSGPAMRHPIPAPALPPGPGHPARPGSGSGHSPQWS